MTQKVVNECIRQLAVNYYQALSKPLWFMQALQVGNNNYIQLLPFYIKIEKGNCN